MGWGRHLKPDSFWDLGVRGVVLIMWGVRKLGMGGRKQRNQRGGEKSVCILTVEIYDTG